MIGREVDAMRREDETRQCVESTRHEPHEIKRGFVGPLEIFEDDDDGMRRCGQLGKKGVEHLRLIAAVERATQRSRAPAGDVGERPERPRSEEVVAAPDQHTAVDVIGDEGLDERRLARTGLPRDQHDLPRLGRAIEQ